VPREGSLAHGRAGSQRRYAQIVVRVIRCPGNDFGEAVRQARLRRQCFAELGLAARPAKKQNHLLGDGRSYLRAMVSLDHRQREIGAGGYAGRRPDGAVGDEDRVRLHACFGKINAEAIAGRPVGCRSTAIEEPSRPEDKRAHAHTADAPRGMGCLRQPRRNALSKHRVAKRALAATRDQNGVHGSSDRSDRHRATEAKPALRSNASASGRGEHDLVGAGLAKVYPREHARWTGYVQRLNAIEDNEHDPSGISGHGRNCGLVDITCVSIGTSIEVDLDAAPAWLNAPPRRPHHGGGLL
jgi:hypothetical protein